MRLRSGVRRVTAAKRTASGEAERSHVPPTKRTNSKPKKRQRRERATSETQQRDLKGLRAKGERISAILEELHPQTTSPLDHRDPFQLLIAVLLSAQVESICSLDIRCGMQTTDRMVNEVTPALFEMAPDPESMAALEVGFEQISDKV